MSRKKQRSLTRSQQGRRQGRRPGRRIGWIVGIAALVVVAVGWFTLREGQTPTTGLRLPGPAGGRDVSQDVNTLVGRQAPSFTLATTDGRTHRVIPGGRRPTVLIFHMGVT